MGAYVSLMVAAIGILLTVAPCAALEDPNLRAAQQALQAAAYHLQAAPDDPGGFRERALASVNHALDHVHRALESGYAPGTREERLERKEYNREEKLNERDAQLEEKREKRDLELEEKRRKREEKQVEKEQKLKEKQEEQFQQQY